MNPLPDSRWRRAVVSVISLALLVLASCSGGLLHTTSEAARQSVVETSAEVKSGGEELRVDIYAPQTGGRHPAAILLHGSTGLHKFGSTTIDRYAQALAERGITSFVVHYFDGTGDFSADDSVETANYFHWVENIKDVVTWVSARPDVQRRRVSLLGHSLGAWLAVGVGAMDTRVYRLVLLGAGLEPFLADSIKRMPPTLLLHGSDDDIVPLSDVKTLQAFMIARGYRVTLHIYAGEEHTFGDSVAIDALTQSANFIAPPRRGLLRNKFALSRPPN
jgi:dienelactone hydrolase